MSRRPAAGPAGPEVMRDDNLPPVPPSGGCWVMNPATGKPERARPASPEIPPQPDPAPAAADKE